MRGMDNVLECRDNVLEYGDLKRVGRTTEYAIQKKVVVYAGTLAVRISGYAKVRHSAMFW